MDKKISNFQQLVNPTGDERVPVIKNGVIGSVSFKDIAQFITKASVGLPSVDNVRDNLKPVGNELSNALNEKADLIHSHNLIRLKGKSDFITTNDTQVYQITNFDKSREYNVSVDKGTIVLDHANVFVTAPNEPTVLTFNVNDTQHSLVVQNPYIEKPSVISLTSDFKTDNFTVSGSSFKTVGGFDTQSKLEWQMSKTSDFATIAYSGILDTSSTSTNINTFDISNAINIYYFRFRYIGFILPASEWSDTISITISPPQLASVESAEFTIFDISDFAMGMFTTVKVSGDGKTIAASIADAYTAQGARTQRIIVMEELSPKTWTVTSYINKPSDVADGVNFAFNIDISFDGKTIISNTIDLVNSSPTNSVNGGVYVFEKDNQGVWNQTNKLTGNVGDNHFGFSIALSSDGNTIAALAYSDNGTGYSAYTFKKNITFNLDIYLDKASFSYLNGDYSSVTVNIPSTIEYMDGAKIRCSANGSKFAISCPNILATFNSVQQKGICRIFEIVNGTVNSNFIHQSVSELINSNFGFTEIALSGDGNTLLVSNANYDKGDSSYIFRDGVIQVFRNLSNTWTLQDTIYGTSFYTGQNLPTGPYFTNSEYRIVFGKGLTVSKDGNAFLVSANEVPQIKDGVTYDVSGLTAQYVYKNNIWQLNRQFLPTRPDYFGQTGYYTSMTDDGSVAISVGFSMSYKCFETYYYSNIFYIYQ